MRKLITALSLLIATSSFADDLDDKINSKLKKIEVYSKEHVCKSAENILSSELSQLKSKWYGKQSDAPYFIYMKGTDYKLNYNLYENLDALKADYSKLHRKIEGIVTKFATQTHSTSDAYDLAIRDLRKDFSSLSPIISGIAISESHYIAVLNHIMWSLGSYESFYEEEWGLLVSDICEEALIEGVFEQLQEHKFNIKAKTTTLLSVVANLRKHRLFLMTYAQVLLETDLTKKQAEVMKADINELLAILHHGLAHNELREKFLVWRHTFSRRISHFFHEYDAQLRQYLIEKEKALDILNRISEDYPNYPEKASMMKTLDKFIEFLEEKASKHRENGWQSVFDRQKKYIATVSSYPNFADIYVASCYPEFDKYKANQVNVVDLETYRESEKIWLNLLDVCVMKRNLK